MKKSLIFFPVFMLLLGGCGTKSDTSGTGTSVTPTSSVAPAPSSSGVAPTSSQDSSHSPVPSSSETPPVTLYTITWKDDLGNNLKVEQVAAGVVPSYGATNPTKTGDAQYSYEFDHWNPTPVAATANAVYTAVFTATTNKYTVRFLDGDGNELSSEQFDYGATPAYVGADPTKTPSQSKEYEWDGGWYPEIATVSGNVDYQATFSESTRKYTIRFLDGDGNELQNEQFDFGATPVYSGPTPTKTAGAHSTYSWDGGWDPAIAEISGEATYTATFTEVPEQLTVRFLVDGDIYDTKNVNYGSTVSAPADDPTKAPDAEVARYVFNGWDADLSQPITENKDINAKWIEYAVEEVVDNFASYDEDHPVDDNTGWEPVKLDGSWGPSSAPIDISENSMEGDQALRFLGYRNGLDFGIRKTFDNDQPARYANAVKIKMMTPSDLKSSAPKFIMNFTVDMGGTPLGITLKHAIPAQTAEWFEVVIPFAHDQWQIWNQEFGSIESIAAGRGLTSLDPAIIPTMLDDFIIYVAYPNGTPQRFATYIDSVSFVTTDSTEVTVHDLMDSYTRYTGYTLSGNVARVDITSATEAHFRIIDLASPVDIQGEYSVNGNSLVFNSDVDGLLDYEGRITDNGQKIEFVSVSSSNAQLQTNLTDIKLNAVQALENAESYSADGVGYSRDHAENTRSGARGAYFMECYNGASGVVSPFGGGDWKLMSNGEQIYLKNEPANAHSGNKYLAFQNFNGKSSRYISWNLFKGNGDLNRYRGSTFSFWAKAKSGTNINKMKVYALSKYNPVQGDLYTPQPSSCKYIEIAESIGTAWKHFEFDLDPNGVYYGFAILVNTNADAWLHIDDVEIYTANPYAEYQEPVTGVSLDEHNIELAKGNSQTLVATVTPAEAFNKNVTWSSDNANVATVSSEGVVNAVGAGNATITVETVDGHFTDTCDVTVTAPLKSYPEGTYKATINIGGEDRSVVVALGNESNGLVAVRINNGDIGATGVTWTAGTKQLTIATTGKSGDYTFGNITATFDQANDKLTNIAFDGTIAPAVQNNGSNEAAVVPMWDCDGTTAELQAMFKRRYDTGAGWQTDTGNTDRVTSNTTEFVSGTGSMKRRGHATGKVAVCFQNDFNPAKAVKNVHFWVYNSSAADINLRIWIYKGTGLSSNQELTAQARVAKTGQWTYISLGTDATIYNFQIAVFKDGGNDPSGTYLSFDNIAAF
ncbi:MAG: Ig-like domain-containing protein [Bacilli bacterium]|nr:Ig-like domain-containing protein [Bacilli bacterium]